MNIFESVILGIIQGLTEFLPVSSSGHLVLLEKIFGVQNNTVFFNLLLHLGTLFAILIFYRKTILKIIKNPFSKLTLNLIFATIPTAIIGLCFKDFFENSFSGDYLVIGFLITSIFLIINQKVSSIDHEEYITPFSAFVAGIFQGVAIMPGISRSGSTITSMIVQGINKQEATEFSFLLSVPTILGSVILQVIDIAKNDLEISVTPPILLGGILSSFLSGIFAIKIMTKVIQKNKYYLFAIYLILLSIMIFTLENMSLI